MHTCSCSTSETKDPDTNIKLPKSSFRLSSDLYTLSPYHFTHEHMHDLLNGRMVNVEVIDFYLKFLLERNLEPSHVSPLQLLIFIICNRIPFMLLFHHTDLIILKCMTNEIEELSAVTVRSIN